MLGSWSKWINLRNYGCQFLPEQVIQNPPVGSLPFLQLTSNPLRLLHLLENHASVISARRIGILAINAKPANLSPQVKDTVKEKELMLSKLKQNLKAAQNRMKQFADKNRTERQFTVGDMVYLKMQPYRETALGLRKSLKLASKFYGTFRILQKVGPVAYKRCFQSQPKFIQFFMSANRSAMWVNMWW